MNFETWSPPRPVFSSPRLSREAVESSFSSLPGFLQTRAEAAGLEGAGLEGEAQQRTLRWNQTSTPPLLMDFKGKPSLGRGTEDSDVLQGQN